VWTALTAECHKRAESSLSTNLKRSLVSGYVVALKILTGDIAWLNGLFPCVKYDGYVGESPFRAKVPKAVLKGPSEADAFQKRVQRGDTKQSMRG
jgi:hypothetical protein